MELAAIRSLITNNEISLALEELGNKGILTYQNDLLLLKTQFNNWERNKHLGIGAPIEEWNRIVYATLHYVSLLEKETKNGIEKKKLNTLAKMELELADGYTKLTELKKDSSIDLIMFWLKERHKDVFEKLLDEERIIGKANSIQTLLSEIDFRPFIQKYKLKKCKSEIISFLVEKNNKINRFIEGWLKYNFYRSQFISDLDKTIEKQKSKHQNYLKSGALGALIGSFGFGIGETSIHKLIEYYESDKAHIDLDSECENESDKILIEENTDYSDDD